MKIASRSRWNVSLFVPDRALFLSELEELKSTRRLRLISKNVAYDLFVPSDTRRDHCTSAPTAVCVVSPNFIGQASGNSTKTRPLRRTSTLGWKITHSGSLISLVRYYLDLFLPLETKRKHRYSTLSSLKATTAADAKTYTQSTCSEDTHQKLRKIPAPS